MPHCRQVRSSLGIVTATDTTVFAVLPDDCDLSANKTYGYIPGLFADNLGLHTVGGATRKACVRQLSSRVSMSKSVARTHTHART